MATRTVSTKLAVDGESEYRASITRINAELKNMQSALRLTESEYKNNANSMAALSAKGEALSRLHETQRTKVDALRSALENARNAQQTYAQKSEELRAKIQANNEALAKLRTTTGDTTAEEEKLKKENEALNAELAQNEKYLAAAEKGANSWQTQLNNAEVQLNNLDAEIKENDKLLDEAKNSTDGCAHSIDEFGNKVEESGDAIEELAQALAAAGLAKTAQEIAEALKACVDSAVAFESSMAGVKRTVGGSDEFIGMLADSFKELSTVMPITTTELASIATTAGQLGIKQENVGQFTQVMAKLATTTDLTADSAATMLAQFANITGITDYERLGAVVASLGDSTATTASRVVEMSQGMAAAASIAGMSERDIMAISAAVGSLGIETASGATSMSTLISTLYKATETGDKLEDFAAVAGMTAEEFKTSWGNNAVSALDAFIQGLNDTERNGKSAIVILEELGITNVRQTKAILGLAQAGDLLSGTIAQANRAWDENTALNEKAAIMYETTEAKITMYKNSVDNLKIAIGDQLTPALGNLADTGTGIVSWAAQMVEQNQWLAPAITAVATSMAVFTATIAGTVTVVKVIIPAIKSLNAVMAANPYILVASAIAAVVAALISLAVTLGKTDEENKKLSASSKQQYDELQRLNAEYERTCEIYGETSTEAQLLKKQIDDATASFESNKRTVEDVKAKTDALIDKQTELNTAYSEATAAVDRNEASCMSLFDRLQELMSIEQKTAGTKQEILAVTELLNDAIPELGLAYDEYTDSLNMTADGIMRVIEAELEAERYQANHDALLEAMRQQEEIEAQKIELQAEMEAALLQLDKAIAERAAFEDSWEDWIGYDVTGIYTEEMRSYELAVSDAKDEVASLTEQEQSLNAAYEENEERINNLKGFYDELANSAENASSVEEQAASRVADKLQKLAEAYKDAYDSARESLDGQISLWDEMDNEAVTSAETLQSAVDSQIIYLQSYADNMDSLLSRNIEGIEAFARNFTDGSAESAAALAGLAMASDDEIRQIMASMSQVDTYKDSLASLFATLETDLTGSLDTIKTEYASAIEEISGTGANVDFSAFIQAVDDAFSDVGVTFKNIGSDAGTGLAEGIEASSVGASSQATAMAQAVVDAVRATLDTHSPSVVMDDIGQNTGEGLSQGIDKSASKVTASAEKMGQQLTEKMKTAGQQSVRSFMQEFEQIDAQTQAAINSMTSSVVGTASALPGVMQGIGAQTISGMVTGLYSNSGSLYNAISGIVNNAIAHARTAAAVHSPSKKTQEIFENVGEGMVVGIESKRERVATATQNVVDDALSIDTSGVMQAAKLLKTSAPDFTALLAPAPQSPASNEEREIDIDVNIEHMEVRTEADIKAISKEIGQDIKQELRRRGRL